MKDSTTIITKWSNLSNWREADISKTSLVDHITDPGVYFFSANAWGIKGKLPGGKHSWVSIFDGVGWKTLEITDIDTIEVQKANILYAELGDTKAKQLIISDRHPATKWFGSDPELIHSLPDISAVDETCLSMYKHGEVKLLTNNCNTLASFIMWACKEDKRFRYVGYKSGKYWNRRYNTSQ